MNYLTVLSARVLKNAPECVKEYWDTSIVYASTDLGRATFDIVFPGLDQQDQVTVVGHFKKDRLIRVVYLVDGTTAVPNIKTAYHIVYGDPTFFGLLLKIKEKIRNAIKGWR